MLLKFKSLLSDTGWIDEAVVSLDADGRIVAISSGADATAESVDGFAIPAFRNAHSHAFQFAMAGLAENHAGDDDFWSWRDAMYGLANSVSPDDVRVIASMLYAELARHGWSHVAEFHYLHHDIGGRPYSNLAAMAEALCEAASDAGIKLTLIPIFYQKGGFGVAPHESQRRFISKTFDEYARLFEATRDVCSRYAHASAGVGVHSLRAVEPADVIRAVNELPDDAPFHLHIAEQLREVEDCVTHLGARPVEWLLDNVDLGPRFNLVHATHMTASETERLAKTGPNVVICPSTEGNLGDGIFPLRDYRAHGGAWSLGTDSHVGLDPFEEIRLLDYGQRLTSHNRNTFGENAGEYAIRAALESGRNAVGESGSGFFRIGDAFDAIVIDAATPQLMEVEASKRLSAIVYSGAKVSATFVNGIKTGANHDMIRDRFSEFARRSRC